MSFRLVQSNLEQPDPTAHRHATLAEVASNADVFTLNEAAKDHAAIADLAGFNDHTVGELSIGWRGERFMLITRGQHQVMQGGRRGSGRTGDRRRRGPNRWVIWVVLEERATGKRVIVATHHAIAKADTSAKWRRPLRAQGFSWTTAALLPVVREHGGIPLVLTGDLNTIPRIVAFARLGVREVKTPATFGKRLRYDRIFATPNAAVTGVHTFATRADHRALAATVTLSGAVTPVPGPDPKPPKPPAPPKPPKPPKPPEEPKVQRLPADLAKRLRDAGLKVVEIPGWQTRGRPASKGPFGPVGVLWHHTGANNGGVKYAEWLAKVGRGVELPPPLCHLSIGRDGVVYVIAAGRANHAGKAKPSGTVAGGDGNRLYVGVECQNNGTEGWKPAQRDAMVTTGIVLAKLLGTSADAQRAHKETSLTGKWDPGNFDMAAFRADIREGLRDGDTAKPEPPTETPYDKLHDGIAALLAEYGPDVQARFTARRRFVDTVTAALKDAPVPTRKASK